MKSQKLFLFILLILVTTSPVRADNISNSWQDEVDDNPGQFDITQISFDLNTQTGDVKFTLSFEASSTQGINTLTGVQFYLTFREAYYEFWDWCFGCNQIDIGISTFADNSLEVFYTVWPDYDSIKLVQYIYGNSRIEMNFQLEEEHFHILMMNRPAAYSIRLSIGYNNSSDEMEVTMSSPLRIVVVFLFITLILSIIFRKRIMKFFRKET